MQLAFQSLEKGKFLNCEENKIAGGGEEKGNVIHQMAVKWEKFLHILIIQNEIIIIIIIMIVCQKTEVTMMDYMYCMTAVSRSNTLNSKSVNCFAKACSAEQSNVSTLQ